MIGGRYEIKHVIGRGGMGEVLLAEDTILGRPVAIKHLVTTEHGEDPATAGKRLLREAKSAARIHHPNVVAIHDLVVEGDDTYIVMEYVPAKNLEQVLLARPLALRLELRDRVGFRSAKSPLGLVLVLSVFARHEVPPNRRRADQMLAHCGIQQSS